ncbi:unnamed protein product [Somion occarium]|uniref:Uncharacterized protein n=1 Tax=Somion occarium TaxID=3059160 RepID=A0ABP1DCQ1_9APHY
MHNVLPAHQTKHLSQLQYPFRTCCFHLAQRDNGQTNGTALWLGAQCLSLYLADICARKSATAAKQRPRVIELGSGVGLSALALSSLGWDVLATDLPDVISAVLSGNIARNISNLPLTSGAIQVCVLDWTIPPDKWTWDNDLHIAASSEDRIELSSLSSRCEERLRPPFDMIISADTMYNPALVDPFLRTLHNLSVLSSSGAKRAPPVYLCIERRDPTLIQQALASAKDTWNFAVERIFRKKVVKAMDKGGLTWTPEDWDGVEIWKLTLRNTA